MEVSKSTTTRVVVTACILYFGCIALYMYIYPSCYMAVKCGLLPSLSCCSWREMLQTTQGLLIRYLSLSLTTLTETQSIKNMKKQRYMYVGLTLETTDHEVCDVYHVSSCNVKQLSPARPATHRKITVGNVHLTCATYSFSGWLRIAWKRMWQELSELQLHVCKSLWRILGVFVRYEKFPSYQIS
jgi:hypothetical protein